MVRFNQLWGMIALCLLWAGTVPAAAQSLSSGSIGGVVQTGEGAPLTSVSVTLTHETSGQSRTIRMPRDGRFEFTILSPGQYALRAEELGYRPQVIRGILVRPGQRVEVPVTLVAVTGVAASADTVAFRGAELAGTGPGMVADVSRARADGYPDERREVLELGRYSSLADSELEMQGLPASMSGVRVDGMPVSTLESSALVPGSLRAAVLPISMFDRAILTATNPDVEWSGHAGGTLDAFTTRGGRGRGVEAFGFWSGEALRSGAAASADGGQTLQGGFLLGGPLIRDTATLVLGMEAWQIPAAVRLADVYGAPGDQLLQLARDAYSLQPSADPVQSQALSTFGHLVWAFSDDTHLDARASFAAVPSAAGDFRGPPAVGIGRSYDGQDLSVGATLTTRFSSRAYQELRVGVDDLSRNYEDVDAFGFLGTARFPGSGLALGPDDSSPRSMGQSVIRGSNAVHFLAGNHRLKFGLSVALASAQVEQGTSVQALFASAEDFRAGQAFLVRSDPAAGRYSFSAPQGAFFAQDSWTAAPGLDVLLGFRIEGERLPGDDVDLNESWRALAGLDNTNVSGSWWRFSPRVGFSLDVQNQHEWVVTGSAGIYSGTSDPVLLGDWIAGDGGTRVTRGFGLAGAVPVVSSGASTPTGQDIALTLLAPEFEAPRSFKADLGINRLLGPGTVIRLATLYRYTDFLPRFSDLNLQPSAVGTDQSGRPLFGELRKQGGVLYAAPGSNRRFNRFDQVVAVNVDGWSRYAGITASVEHEADGDGIDWFASYTFSQTRDNWMPGRATVAGAALAPMLQTSGPDWMEGRSDFDVPHRAVAGVEVNSVLLEGLRTAVMYRFRSGYPFTPGFREGVDINGDGSFRNDPAFVDQTVQGMDAVIGSMGCLQGQVGGFAERNSCRTSGIHSLEARLSFAIARFGRYSGELIVDGLNLLASGQDYPDTALYLVDPAGSVTVDAATRRVNVPLVANENFGRPLGTFEPGRMLRLGFRLTY